MRFSVFSFFIIFVSVTRDKMYPTISLPPKSIYNHFKHTHTHSLFFSKILFCFYTTKREMIIFFFTIVFHIFFPFFLINKFIYNIHNSLFVLVIFFNNTIPNILNIIFIRVPFFTHHTILPSHNNLF